MSGSNESNYLPLNNLDVQYYGEPISYAPNDLLDEVPCEPAIDELYVDATPEVLQKLGHHSFYSGFEAQLRSAATIDQRASTVKTNMTNEELVLQALGLAIDHVRDNHAGNREGIQITDRVQNAARSLCGAVKKLDQAKNRSLFGFAQPHLDSHIIRYERGESTEISHGDIIRIPRKESKYHAINRLLQGREHILEQPVEPAELPPISTFTQEDIEAYEACRITHEPFEEGDEPMLLAAGASPDLMDEYCGNDVNSALGLLNSSQRDMLIARLGLDGRAASTPEEIAVEFNVTVSWARNNTSAALRKLREIPDILQIILGEKDPGDIKAAETRSQTPVIQLRPKKTEAGELAEAS